MNKKYKALQENKNIINTIENFNGIPVSKSDKEEIIEAFNEAKLITSRIKRLRGKGVDVFRESVVQLIHPIYIKYSLNYKVLSDLLGISPGSLSGWFKKSELNPLSNQPGHPNHPTKYRCDEAKFKEWSPNMAYWLGFIWADGHIRNEKYRKHLRIVLSYRDKEHLFLLKDFLKSDIPLVESKVELKNGSEYDVISIVINRKKLVDSLVEYNIFPNRSNDGVAFPEVPDKYSWCFIRGYFDGDGAIYRNQCCNFALSGWVLSFSGSKVNMTYLKKSFLMKQGLI